MPRRDLLSFSVVSQFPCFTYVFASLIPERRSESEKRMLAFVWARISLSFSARSQFSWCSVFIFHFHVVPTFHFSLFCSVCSSTFPSTFDGVTDCSLSLAVFIFHFSEWLVVKNGSFFSLFFTVFHFFSLPLSVCVFLTENSLFWGSKMSHEKAFVTGLHSPA